MAKISELTLVERPDGSETAVVLANGVAQRVPVGPLVEAAVQPLADRASAAANAAQAASLTAQALSRYCRTRAEGIAAYGVGEYFCSAETGALRVYRRIAAAPFYEDEGDAAAPITSALLASTDNGKGAALVGMPGGGTVAAELAARAKAADLASTGTGKGAALVGVPGGGTVAAELAARARAADLASTDNGKGAALIGVPGGGTVAAELAARARAADLASTDNGKGAALVGVPGGGTVAAELAARMKAADLASGDNGKGASLVKVAGGASLQDVIVPCLTRTALAARNDRTTMAYLLESGRQGYFYWSPGNLAAAVAADSAQAFYVPPSNDATGASGAWVRAAVRPGVANLTWFGAKGTGADDTVALLSALAWLNAAQGRTLEVPVGTFAFSVDLRIMQYSTTIVGLGGGQGGLCRLMGTGGARIILGQAINGPLDSNGLVTKTGTKVQDVTLSGLSIQPVANHAGECLLVDFADNTLIERCTIGPFSNDGSTVTIGIKTNWVQWLYIDKSQINVNGVCIWLRRPSTALNNEDHIHITRNQLYTGKVPPTNGFLPANIVIEGDAGSPYAMFELVIAQNHIGKFMSGSTAATTFSSGIRTILADTSGDFRTAHYMTVRENFFEYVNYPVDLARGSAGGKDTSYVRFLGNSVLSAKTVLLGSGVSKCSAEVAGNYILQCEAFASAVRLFFTGHNRLTSCPVITTDSYNWHRYYSKGGSSAISGVQLEAGGTAAVATTATYVDITHGLSQAPDRFSINAGSAWGTPPSFWISNIGATTFRVNFASPTTAATLRWEARLADY